MKIVRKVLKWALIALLIVIVALGVTVGPTAYRAYMGIGHYDTVPPALPSDLPSPAILVFSKTNGFRHDESITAANAMLASAAKQRGWAVFATENAAVFNPADLARFRVVVFNNSSGDVFDAAQRKTLVDYLNGGGGFVGIHATGGDFSYKWRWHVDDLIGAQFVGHTIWPHYPIATVRVEQPQHPIMAGVPMVLSRADEWYSFDKSVRAKGYQVLATLDEDSYLPGSRFTGSLHMGKDHPIIWTHCIGKGRVFYSALGHTPESYAEPAYRALLTQAVAWAGAPGGCEAGK